MNEHASIIKKKLNKFTGNLSHKAGMEVLPLTQDNAELTLPQVRDISYHTDI